MAKNLSGQHRALEPRLFEGVHVEPRHVAPHHLAAQLVGILADGIAARRIAQQADHLARDGLGVAEGHQHSALFRQQFGGVPIRRRDHGLARAKRVSECPRRDLRFVEIRRNVEVRRANELLQFFEFHEAVVEDDVLLDFVLLGQDFEAETVGLTALAQLVRMRGAQDDINNVREFRQNLRQSVQHMLNSLVRRKQPEREQHNPSFHAKLVLVIIRIDKRYVGNAMRDEIDLGRRAPGKPPATSAVRARS